MSEKDTGWTTQDELTVLSYLGGKGVRHNSSSKPTVQQRRYKLESWLKHSFSRRWDNPIDLEQCQKFAKNMLSKI